MICAETVMNPVQLYDADQIPEMEDELKFLFTIRSVFYLVVVLLMSEGMLSNGHRHQSVCPSVLYLFLIPWLHVK